MSSRLAGNRLSDGSSILIGTSGWQYEDWRGRLYPRDLPKTRWLDHFSARFPTVEVNNTFYRLPEPATFDRWRSQSAADFVITVKASRYITHIRRLRDCADPIALLWSRCERLGPKLGAVLFQLPPRFAADPDLLKSFCALLPAEMRAAFEFRDRSWEQEPVFEILDRAGAAFVLADSPGARVPHVVTGGWSYVRFHKGTRTSPGYTRAKLRAWAERIRSMSAPAVYVYFNNDTGGAALRDASALSELLGYDGVVPLEREVAL
jgi:uncharacterized protein YecE (DUF72 family)